MMRCNSYMPRKLLINELLRSLLHEQITHIDATSNYGSPLHSDRKFLVPAEGPSINRNVHFIFKFRAIEANAQTKRGEPLKSCNLCIFS
jgi:hypothetical protein